MSEPQVYLNGKSRRMGYGYSYFYFDVSQFIQEGDNTVAVKLTNKEFAPVGMELVCIESK
jgi:beta-galactosidase